MAENERTDMTEHDRGTPLAETETKTTTTTRDGTPAQPAGTTAPVVPGENPQQPAGVVPPGGPAKSTGDILAERQGESQASAENRQGLQPTDEQVEHAKDAGDDTAKGTPG